jgi:hypothetical protein
MRNHASIHRHSRPFLLFAFTASGQIPRTISYQGVLCDAAGKPKPDNSYQMTFRLYQDSTGGTAAWSEQKNLQVTRGLIHTMLGDVVVIPASLLFDKPYWLGVQVGSEEELTPRIPFSSVPFSFAAMTAGPWQQSGNKLFYTGGNVGIPTSNPNFPLEVKDGIVVTGSEQEGGQLTLMNGEGSGNGWIVDNYGTGGNEVLRFFKQQGSNITHALELSGSGNVGIGGVAGSDKLEVAGTIKSNSGGFKFPDGTVQTTAAAGGGGSGPWQTSGSDISYSSGNVGIGTSSPAAKLHVVDGSLLLSGTTGGTPASGTGRRFMWIPAKGAFRAGIVDGTQWDDANIGFASTAMGIETTADGQIATAMGCLTGANGHNSTAMGFRTTASGEYSTAMGSTTTASSGASTAMGSSVSTNNHWGSFIIGDYKLPNVGVDLNSSDNQFLARFSGGYALYTNSGCSIGAWLKPNENSWTVLSDSAEKENFTRVDGEALLAQLRHMRLGTWNYKGQDPSLYRHYGPMAQEFHAAFGHDGIGVAGDDTTINQADLDGVSMTAIQALEKRTAELKEKTAELQQKTAELKRKADELEMMKAEFEKFRSRLAHLEQVLPLPKDLTQRIADDRGSAR